MSEEQPSHPTGRAAAAAERAVAAAIDALRQIRDEMALMNSEIGQLRNALANVSKPKYEYDTDEWWKALSLIQQLEQLVGQLQPVVRHRQLRGNQHGDKEQAE